MNLSNHHFVPIKPENIRDNPIKMFRKDWAIIASGSPEDFNVMTISWGALGTSWGNQLPIAIIFVSSNRYTHWFLKRYETFSINVLPRKYKKVEAYLGSHSGRDGNKLEGSGLDVAFSDRKTPVFLQARLIIECKKIYAHELDPDQFSETLRETYRDPIFRGVTPHTIYYGEIISCLEHPEE